jgi:hypothetical protein
MRDFSKVSPKLWRSGRFRDLSDDARLLYLFLLTCEHQTSAGCCRIPGAYATADLGAKWTAERLHAARDHLSKAELIVHDDNTDEYFVCRWFKHNPPTNQKHLQGVRRMISELDSEAVREVAAADLLEDGHHVALVLGRPLQ